MDIHIIGLGVSEHAELPHAAQQVIGQLTSNDVLVGSERQLAMVADYGHSAQPYVLPKLAQLKLDVETWQQQDVPTLVILASGDPLYFGIGSWVQRHFSAHNLTYYPNVSSIQAACHRAGIALQNSDVVSVHGRPLVSLRTHLHPSKTLVLLTDKTNTPQAIAQECLAMGLNQSELIVCERLGYEQERVSHYSADELANVTEAFDPLNVVILKSSAQTSRLPSTPGFPDILFETDKGQGRGMITKREVRLAVLSYLGAEAGEVLWDIGAGCGGVSIELAYWNPNSHVYAIEHHDERFACLQTNREQFGVVKNLHPIQGRAPEAFADLPRPKRVFIGGSDGELGELLAIVWQQLPVGGVLLVSAVTDETNFSVMQFLQVRDTQNDALDESITLQVSRSERLAGKRMRRPHLPVTLWRFEKQAAGDTCE